MAIKDKIKQKLKQAQDENLHKNMRILRETVNELSQKIE